MKKLLFFLALALPPSLFAQQQTINVGTSANDHSGDPLRTAFQKANANFTDLYGDELQRVTASGTDSYTATSTHTAYVSGMPLLVTFTNGNTTSATLTLSNISGTKTIKKNVSDNLESGDIIAGQTLLLRYGGTNWEIVGSIAADPEWGAVTGTLSDQSDLQSALDAKQASLVSGTNIKTINGTSLLGSGNISVDASDGDKGDITVASAGTAWSIDAGAVTGSKIASSVALAGSPTTTTQSASDNSTKIATTAYVTAKMTASPSGQIYSDNFARSSLGGNYTQTGSTATFTCDGTKLTLAGGIGTVTEYIVRNTNYTNAEDYTVKCSFKVISTPGATTYGAGIIAKSNSSTGNANQVYAYFNGSTSSQGKITIAAAGGLSITSANGLTISQNDIIDFTFSRVKGTFIATIYNETTKLGNSTYLNFPLFYPNSSVIPPAVQFGLMELGGTYTVGNNGNPFTYTSDVATNADYVWITDSILSGYYSGGVANRPASILQNLDKSKKHVVYGVQGTTTTDMINCQSEIVALIRTGTVVFMNIGKNDASNTTANTNIGTLITAFQSAGATVINLSIIGNATLNGLIISTYPSNQYIDIFSPLSVAAGDFADGAIHPSRLGAMKIARNIYSSCRSLFNANNPSIFSDDGVWLNPGALSGGVSTVTTTYTALEADSHIKANGTSGAFTVTLLPVAYQWGRIVYVTKTDATANVITVKGNSSETIDGSNTILLSNQYDVVGLQCDASTWKVISFSSSQIVSSLIATGSAISLTTATPANVTSISLTAGTWDLVGQITFKETSATVTARSGGITSTSATVPSDGSEAYFGVNTTTTTENNTITLSTVRVSPSTTTTYYLPASVTFSAGTVAAFGKLIAKRVK